MEAMKSPHERALRDIDEVFGDRLKRGRSPRPPGAPDTGEALASVSPMSAEEVEILVKAAGRYSVPLVALGAGTASTPQGGSILVHFDLMRGLRLPEREEPWVEAEPGASWLQLDDLLRARGWGLAVYPTSAPRTTVGGWLTQDGLGVGSFRVWVAEREPPVSECGAAGRRTRRLLCFYEACWSIPNSSRYLFNVCKKEGTFIGHPRTMSSTCITSLSFLTSLP
jgi:FAD binding domain